MQKQNKKTERENKMTVCKAYWVGDSGHAWLVVPKKLAQQVSDISAYSYQSPSGSKAYLEEDCDARLFIEHYGEDNIELGKPVMHACQAPLRNYPRYNKVERIF